MPSATLTFSAQKEKKMLYADECEEQFHAVTQNAEQIDMKLNERKNPLLCISPRGANSEVTSYIQMSGVTLESEKPDDNPRLCYG